MLASTEDELRADGFSRQKQGYVRDLAVALLEGDLDLEALAGLPDAEVRRLLTAQNGIGNWTADVYLLSCLRRPDLWPVGDRALQVAAAETLGLAGDTRSRPVWRRSANAGVPTGPTAARILWHGYLSRRGRTAPPA